MNEKTKEDLIIWFVVVLIAPFLLCMSVVMRLTTGKWAIPKF